MKLIMTADFHIGQLSDSYIEKNGMERSVNETFNQIDCIIDYAIKNKIKTIIIAGDIFEEKNPTAKYYYMFLERLKVLNMKEIETILISGNHDKSNSGISAISPVRNANFENILVYDDIQVKIINNINYIFIPHVVRNQLKENEEIIEHITQMIFEYLDTERKNIVIGHLHYDGAVIGNEQYNLKGGINFFPEVNTRKIKKIFLGHIHKHQRIQKNNTEIIYTGSITRNDFGECEEDKGFLVYDDKTDEVDFVKLDTTKYKIIELNYPGKLTVKPEKYNNCILKLKINVNEKDRKSLNIAEIESMFNEHNYIAKIEINTVKKAKKGIEINEYNPIEILNRFVDENYEQKKLNKFLKSKGKEIIEKCL